MMTNGVPKRLPRASLLASPAMKVSVAALVLLMITAVGCASSESEAPTAAARATTVVVGATATTTTTIQELRLPAEGEAWDLVYLSNSFGDGVAEHYAAHAEAALGVTVNAYEQALSFLNARQALQYLQDIRYPPMADLVRNAEIIVMSVVPERAGEWDDTCWFDNRTAFLPTTEYTEDDWQQYRQELEALFAEIWQLRQGLPTVVRTVDSPIGMISEWRELGKEQACIAGWKAIFAVLRQAADVQGVTMVSIFDVFNGVDHDEDPREKGWISGDGRHPNDAGAAAIADALAAVGFDLNDPPEQ